MVKRLGRVAAMVTVLVVNPAVSHAQVKVEITPFGGLYLPTANAFEASEAGLNAFEAIIADLADVSPGDISLDELTAKQKSGVLFGARVGAWITEAFGLEAGFAYSASDGETSIAGDVLQIPFSGDICGVVTVGGDDFPGGGDCGSNVWMGSVKGLYRFGSQPAGIWSMHLGGGLALISRGGDFWDGIDGTTDIGGVLNVGATFDVSTTVGIRLDVEDYIYSAKFEVEGFELGDGKLQNDLFFTGGIAIKLGG